MNHWSSEYAASAALAVVYIEEAHASDEWPISSARMAPSGAPVCIPSHKTLPDRLAAAAAFCGDFAVPEAVAVAVDAMGNGFQTLYAAWPIRWYVFAVERGGVVLKHIGRPDESSFDMGVVFGLLEEGAAAAVP